MGILDGFKKENKQQSEGRVENNLLEIIKIVSFQNTEILKLAQECIESTSKYYEDHEEDFENRGLSMEDELDFLQWIGCIDLLINNEFACECDWKEEKDEFVSQISSLQGIETLSLEIDSKWFDQSQAIPDWCEILDNKWKESNCVVAAFDIDSDSYVMFPCKKDDIERLSVLAEGFGYRIDFAKHM